MSRACKPVQAAGTGAYRHGHGLRFSNPHPTRTRDAGTAGFYAKRGFILYQGNPHFFCFKLCFFSIFLIFFSLVSHHDGTKWLCEPRVHLCFPTSTTTTTTNPCMVGHVSKLDERAGIQGVPANFSFCILTI